MLGSALASRLQRHPGAATVAAAAASAAPQASTISANVVARAKRAERKTVGPAGPARLHP